MAIDGGASISAELARFDDLVERYPDYLRGQRGLSENTVRIYLDDIGSFRHYLNPRNYGPSDAPGIHGLAGHRCPGW